MQPTPMNCRILNLVDFILIKIAIEGVGSRLLGTWEFGGGKRADGSGGWNAMTLVMSLLGAPRVTPV